MSAGAGARRGAGSMSAVACLKGQVTRALRGAAAAALLCGCAKAGGRAPSTPAPESSPGVWQGGDAEDTSSELAALERELRAEEERLRAAGVRAAGDTTLAGGAAASAAEEQESKAEMNRGPADRGERCERICAIKGAICGLERRICGLRDRHVEEPGYEDLCQRAAVDCRMASEACDGCV